MFVYLSKKIAIPHNLHLQVIAWNLSNGYIACGGERGLLKVIKLESSSFSENAAGVPGGSGPGTANAANQLNNGFNGGAGGGMIGQQGGMGGGGGGPGNQNTNGMMGGGGMGPGSQQSQMGISQGVGGQQNQMAIGNQSGNQQMMQPGGFGQNMNQNNNTLNKGPGGANGGGGGGSNLSMNQTLEGHQAQSNQPGGAGGPGGNNNQGNNSIMVLTWNEQHKKLTSSDSNGLIIVWMLHRSIWFEEMINNRMRSTVRDMKWNSDGSKICICYLDGAVIVGTVDGQRLWGKELPNQLSLVEWGPDGRCLLFCTLNGECHIYDPDGNFLLKIPNYCLDQSLDGQTALAGIHWYDPGPTKDRQNMPSLCCAFENGRVMVLRNESDDKPIIIDTQMRCTACRWNPQGTVIAISGMQTNSLGQAVGVVQFYSASNPGVGFSGCSGSMGEHLRSLRVPGNNLRSLSWEGNGLRLALAVDSHIFFANVRINYLSTYVGRSLIYAVPKKDGRSLSDFTVVFWNTQASQTQGVLNSSGPSSNSAIGNQLSLDNAVNIKSMRYVVAIKSGGDHCVIITKTEENQYQLLLCDEIGSPLDKIEVVFPLPMPVDSSTALNNNGGSLGGGGTGEGDMNSSGVGGLQQQQITSNTMANINRDSNQTGPNNPGQQQQLQLSTIQQAAQSSNAALLRGAEMTKTHIVLVTTESVYVWNYSDKVQSSGGQGNGGPSVGTSTGANTSSKKAEQMFHVTDQGGFMDKDSYRLPQSALLEPTKDSITAMTVSESTLLIARESGIVQRYTLPYLQKDGKFNLKPNPQILAMNNNSTKLLVVDINGLLSQYKIRDTPPNSKVLYDGPPGSGMNNDNGINNINNNLGNQPSASNQVVHLDFERKDVWSLKWASDNPDLFCFNEKTRLYVVRGTQPEEPVLSTSYICEFTDLEIKSALMDDLVRNPENPRKEHFLTFETKSLRDTRDIINKLANLKDAFNYCEDNPHPRLWRLLAEAALDALDFTVAEKAFVRWGDFSGIQLVKRLKIVQDKIKQRAEVCSYFQRFDDAESLYREIDRRDLAVEMRVKLGDWFRVIQLVQGSGSNDTLLLEAWSSIGDYYAERGKWSHAAQYYSKSRDHAKLIETYYYLEDYDSLCRFISQLPEGSPLLLNIAEKLVSVGLCEQAVRAYLRLGDVSSAIDACVLLNSWDLAIDLAKKERYTEIEELLSTYAQQFLNGGPGSIGGGGGGGGMGSGISERLATASTTAITGQGGANNQAANQGISGVSGPNSNANNPHSSVIEAVQLYRKAHRYNEASRLLLGIADEIRGSTMMKAPDKIKKLYLLSAMELEKKKEGAMGGKGKSANTNADTLSTLMDVGSSVPELTTKTGTSPSDLNNYSTLSSPWRGAEAYHLLMLCQNQIYNRQFDNAVRSAIRLTDYEDLIDLKTIYSLVALTSFHTRFFKQCSKAFLKLKASGSVTSSRKQEQFEKLSVKIFRQNGPRDQSNNVRTHPCPSKSCSNQHNIPDYAISCDQCSQKLPFCVTSGRTIFSLGHGNSQQSGAGGEYIECRNCRRKSYASEARNRVSCAFCHARLHHGSGGGGGGGNIGLPKMEFSMR